MDIADDPTWVFLLSDEFLFYRKPKRRDVCKSVKVSFRAGFLKVFGGTVTKAVDASTCGPPGPKTNLFAGFFTGVFEEEI